MAKHLVQPGILRQRPNTPHNHFSQGRQVLGLSDVDVHFGTPTRNHVVDAPTGEGMLSRTLRRFALCLSRYKLPDAKKRAKAWSVHQETVDTCAQIFSTIAFQNAFEYDPTPETVNVDMLAKLLLEPNPNPLLFIKASALMGTHAFQELMDKCASNHLVWQHLDDINSMRSWIMRYYFPRVSRLNHKDKYYRRYALKAYKQTAQEIENKAQSAVTDIARATAKKQPKPKSVEQMDEEDTYANGKAQSEDGAGWHKLFVAKPDLPLNHTGLLGRRIVSTDSGTVIRDASRWYTDRERRIFARKTRSLGAVVVADCSGSMGLDENDLSRLMSLSSGATVLCYSSGHSPSFDHPNAWIVARNGRQVRSMPKFPGGNGCDGPALRYAVRKLRSSARQPVIWISDQHVTGNNDNYSHWLKVDCDNIIKRHGIYCAHDLHEAERLIKQLQGKG